jgi:DNA-binding NarL/FixJ family response regulator
MNGTTRRAKRALIIHRQQLFAEALVRTLGRIDVAATAVRDHDLAIDAIDAFPPDVVLIEAGYPGSRGESLAERIRASHPGTALIAVTVSAEPGIDRSLRAAGFRFVVTRDMPLPLLLRAVESALADIDVRDRPVSGGATQDNPRVAFLARQLTDREWQVLELLVDGASGDDIAAALGLRANTVRSHVQGILTKLQVHSRLEAAGFAVRSGLVRAHADRPR